ncbi:unnamed protein product [Closterium sp. Naga37s-1]|nr:unnamed protein product [Closterium sp. Naga37s-1]
MKQEEHQVASTDHVRLCVKTWPARPSFDGGEYEQQQKQALLAVIVHPYSRMGGSQAVTQGLAECLCLRGFNVVTFDLRGAGRSTGHASFTGEPEVADVMAVCRWAGEEYAQRILLLGSSAGASIAGSALPQPAGGPVRGRRFPLAPHTHPLSHPLPTPSSSPSSPCRSAHCRLRTAALPALPPPPPFTHPAFYTLHSVVTFDLRGAGRSTGHASFTGEPEVADVMAVCRWAGEEYAQRILLLGSSAGASIAGSALPQPAGGPVRAPIAGSALPHCPQVDLYVGVGYTFGFFSSLLFGSHFSTVLAWPGPKLFIMGAKDEFTSTKQLEARAGKAVGVAKVSIVEGVGHFGLEGPAYDEEVAKRVGEFVAENAGAGAGGGRGGEVGAGGEEGIKESDS